MPKIDIPITFFQTNLSVVCRALCLEILSLTTQLETLSLSCFKASAINPITCEGKVEWTAGRLFQGSL